MSDSAQGFIVLGAARTKVQRWLGSRQLSAFLAAGPGKALRLWPHVEGEAAEEAATALSRELPKSRVLVFSITGDSRPGFLALVGVKEEDIASLSHARLVEARQHPEAADAARFQDFSYIDAQGKAHAFFPGAPAQEA